jgi:hypothetical protein
MPNLKHATQIIGANHAGSQISADAWNATHSLTLPFVTVGTGSDCDYVTDGTADDVQLQAAITAMANKGTIQLMPNTSYTLANPINIVGLGSDKWDPTSQISLIGCGYSTIINNSVNSANQHGIILSNEAQVNIKNLKIRTTQGHCIYGADTGSDKESVMRSYIGEVYLKCLHASYAGMYIQNPFWNHFGYAEVNSAGDGVVFDATDTTGINPIGNCNFDFLMCNATGTGKYGLTLKTTVASGLVYMKFHRVELGGSTANGIKLSVATASQGQIVDNEFYGLYLEGGTTKILIDAGNSSGAYPHIDHNHFKGYMDCTSAATSIDASATANNHGSNIFDMDCWLDAADSVILNDKGTWYHGVSEYNLRIFGAVTMSATQFTLGGTSPIVRWTSLAADGSPIKNPNAGATANVSDGGTITHGVGLEPTWVIAQGTNPPDYVVVTAVSSTTFTVAIKRRSDNASGSAQTIYWKAGWYNE